MPDGSSPQPYFVKNWLEAVAAVLGSVNGVLFNSTDRKVLTLLTPEHSGRAPFELALRLLSRKHGSVH
jgi:hypothetical protein